MKAILALLWMYCGGTTLGRQVSIVAAICVAIGLGSRIARPEFGVMFQTGYMPDASPLVAFLVAVVPMLGLFGLFFGTFMLPVVLSQLSATRRLRVLPHGRLIVIVSAVACVTLVALACTSIFAFYVPPALRDDFRTFAASLAGFTMLYVVLWLITRSRTPFGRLSSGMLLIAALAIPAWLAPRVDTVEYVVATLVAWTIIGLAVGRAARSPGLIGRLKARFASDRSPARESVRTAPRASEQERVDALVGTAKPWLVACGPVLPFVIAVFFVRSPAGWLFYLTLFTMLAGAIASVAARRSRALWLRAGWTREEIFTHLERAFWRQNRYALILLMLAHASIAAYFSLPTHTAVLGVPLLGLAASTSTYLGLMITRRLHWAEVPLTLATMTLVMTAAISIADAETSIGWAAGQLLALLAATLTFRALARRRWHMIDWTLARASSMPEA